MMKNLMTYDKDIISLDNFSLVEIITNDYVNSSYHVSNSLTKYLNRELKDHQ